MIRDDINIQNPRVNLGKDEKITSFTHKYPNSLMPTNEKAQNDFTDDSFFKMKLINKKESQDSSTKDFLQRLRSKTYKEDDHEYFNFSTMGE